MLVRFWGTRGSLPVALTAQAVQEKVAAALVAGNDRNFSDLTDARSFVSNELNFAAGSTYGGATTCVEIEAGDDAYFVCDMGSGLREFGLDAMRRCNEGHSRTYCFFMSHLHWDHIMGFPFFTPAFDPEARIIIHSCHEDAERALRRQQEEISFPVSFDWLRASIEFVTLSPGQSYSIDGVKVDIMHQHHSHESFGYRFTDSGGKSVVFSTDSEHKLEHMEGETDVVQFFKDADLVICDTMYSLADSVSMKEDWGHSSNIVAIDLCHKGGAKRLALFHHEPMSSDSEILQLHLDSMRYEELTREGLPLEVLCAHDGQEIEL